MRMVYVFPRTDLWKAALLSLLSIVMFSCSNELHMVFPEGPEGPAGKSAYEIWADEVNNGNIDWPKDRVDVNNFFLYLKGEDGKDGQDGQDGKSAYELWKEQVAEGLDNPKNPGTEWPKDETDLNDFWYYLTGADGKDGVTPNVGSNGNWWVNGEDTGIPAKGEDGKDGTDGEDGKDGEDGHTPVIEIKDGYWYIDGVNTGQAAQGPKGDKGDDGETGAAGGTGGTGDKGEPGKSAYELWVEEVKKGNIEKNGVTWPDSKTGLEDFWDYLRGEDGADGKSAYEIWKENVENGTIDWDKDKVDVNNFFLYLKGTDGEDGKSAYELWKEEVAKGLDNPKNPDTEWPKDETDLEDFWYYLTGADGKNGVTPNIGDNGNWWVNGEDTGIPATGKDGEDGEDGDDGKTPTIEIKNGNWWIDGKDTGQSALGTPGASGSSGSDGKSAYDLWVEDVKDGGAQRADGTTWTESMGTEVSDFWEFLTGPKGDDGEDGEDGKDGNNSGFVVEEGQYNVIAQYAHNEGGNQEYIAWNDGSVTYLVLNPKGEFVAEGTKVKLPQTRVAESAKDKEYTTEKNAQGASVVVVPYSDLLPNGENNINVAVGSSQVEEDGEFVETAKNTYVPVQMQVRLQFQVSNGVQLLKDGRIPSVMFYLRVQRKESDDSEWEALPTYITVDLTPMHWIHYVAADGQEAESGPYTPSNGPVRTQKYTYASDGGRPADRLIPIYFHRQFIKTEHTNNAVIEAGKGYGYYWGDNVTEKRYFRIGMTGLYGQTAMMDAWLQDLPAQFAPIVNDMTITRYDKISETRLDIISLKGSFQTDYIKDECLYTGYSKSDRVVTEDGLRAYEGVNEPETIKNLAALNVTFSVGGQSVVLDQEVSLDSPDFVVSKRTVSLIKGEEYNVSFAWGGDYHNFYEISNEKPFTGNACHLKWDNDLDVWLIPGTYVQFEQFKLKYESSTSGDESTVIP